MKVTSYELRMSFICDPSCQRLYEEAPPGGLTVACNTHPMKQQPSPGQPTRALSPNSIASRRAETCSWPRWSESFREKRLYGVTPALFTKVGEDSQAQGRKVGTGTNRRIVTSLCGRAMEVSRSSRQVIKPSSLMAEPARITSQDGRRTVRDSGKRSWTVDVSVFKASDIKRKPAPVKTTLNKPPISTTTVALFLDAHPMLIHKKKPS